MIIKVKLDELNGKILVLKNLFINQSNNFPLIYIYSNVKLAPILSMKSYCSTNHPNQ